jgi:hypothetical protein
MVKGFTTPKEDALEAENIGLRQMLAQTGPERSRTDPSSHSVRMIFYRQTNSFVQNKTHRVFYVGRDVDESVFVLEEAAQNQTLKAKDWRRE